MKNKKIVLIVLTILILLPIMAFPVSAANTYSYSYLDSPFLTEEMKNYFELGTEIKPNDKALIYFRPSLASQWYEGRTWEQISQLANEMEKSKRWLVIDTITDVDFYCFRNYNEPYDVPYGFESEVRHTDKKYVAERLLSLDNGYRYDGQTYTVENIYWFDGDGYGEKWIGGGYAAIVTDGGVFFEHYNLIYWEEDVSKYKVLTFTQEEFEKWYPEFIRARVEGSSEGIGGGGGNGEFDAFLLANGFTPRYGEAQGVTRRVLTYGGMSLAVVGIVGGITYVTVRRKRKKKAALPEAEEIA